MKIGPRYKIARRLGVSVFGKTETQKFAIRAAAKKIGGKRPKSLSEFGRELMEKQRARMYYGMTERQFGRYVKEAAAERNPEEILFQKLETRLDNAVYRLGFASSRQAARQFVSHGHIILNGKKVNIPSFNVKVGDIVGAREGSKKTKVFASVAEKAKDMILPPWLSFNPDKLEGKILNAPKLNKPELLFDIGAIIEYYRR